MNIFAASILIEFMARRVHRRAAKKSVHVGTMGPKAAGQSELSWKLKLKVKCQEWCEVANHPIHLQTKTVKLS